MAAGASAAEGSDIKIIVTGEAGFIGSTVVRYSIRNVGGSAAVDKLADTSNLRSLAPAAFISANIVGTFTLLHVARGYWQGLDSEKKCQFRFHHISTDEVYGDLESDDPPFTETILP